jgi:hypothetical protein
MARSLPLSLSCYYSDRVAGTLVLDPAEANPPGAPAGWIVRLYDTGSSGLRPWVELPWSALQPVTSSRAIEAALERYAGREQRAAEAQQRLATKHKRQLREARAARSARAAEQRAAAWAAKCAELHAAERAAEAARYAAAAREAAQARIAADAELARARLARVRHRDSSSGDALLEVFEIGGMSLAPRTLVLFDPNGQPDDGGAFVFRPSGAAPLGPLAGVSHPSGYPGSRGIFSESRRRKLISRYRAWQAGEREEERLELLRAAYRDALSGVRRAAQAPPDDAVALHSLPLMRKDISLALAWCRGEDAALHDRLRERLGRCGWERSLFLQQVQQASRPEWPAELTLFKKMLSARLAETAVKQFYEEHDPTLRPSGRSLTDMSIRQLEGGLSFDPQYDLGYPDGVNGDGGDPEGIPVPKRLDVKNSRLDPSDPNGYSRHYVKKLRVLRDGAPVRIVGAVSEVASLAGLLRRGENDGIVRILGEVDRERMDHLEKRYGLSHLKLNLTEEGKEGQFYPPWLFEAPPFMVSAYFAALDALRDACRHHPEPDAQGVVPIPMALAAGIPIHAVQRERLTPAQVALVDALLRRDDLSRRSLPHIYLTLIRQFFILLAGPPENRIGYDPGLFRELLFLQREGSGPLGLPDPLGSVAGLLESLSTLLRHGWEQLTQFTRFEFQKAGILYAFKQGPRKRWTLMFTHCRQVKQCGGKRLVFGQEKLCEDCHHLICRNCSYCEAGCAGLEKRGVQVVVASRAKR